MNRFMGVLARIDWALVGLVLLLCSVSVLNLHSTSKAANSDIYLVQLT